jgi:dihydrofolate reductase
VPAIFTVWVSRGLPGGHPSPGRHYPPSPLLKRESGKGLFVGGVKLPLALAELGLIDEYEFVVHPRLAGHGPTLFAGLSKLIDLKLVSRLEFASGAVAMRYEPRR